MKYDLTPEEKRKATAFLNSLPGKRGADIPEHIHDVITKAGHGMAMQVWGRPLEPEQIQWLYDNGHHTPAQVLDALGNQPHPHAPNISVKDYGDYAQAHQVWMEHRR